MEICELSITELAGMVGRKELSPLELLEAHLGRIERCDGVLRSYITLNEEECRRTLAQSAASRRVGAGDAPRTLDFMPLAVKDNICTKGLRTTCASRVLDQYVPPYDATAVARLRKEGVLLLGKTNLDEFGMGSSTENSCFGPTKNPWDLSRVPGGSSGGSAAAVAAGLAVAALGSDTGGSARQPAALCGVVGYKPTYGVISRRGLVAFASSLDQIGIIARNVRDVALVLEAVSGWDEGDSTCAGQTPVKAGPADAAEEKLRVGVPWKFLSRGVEEDVLNVTRAAIRKLETRGWVFEEIDLPHAEYSIAAYYLVADSEASSNLARYDGVRYGTRVGGEGELMDMYVKTRSSGFGREVKRRIMLGTYSLSAGYYDAYYLRAQKARTMIRRDYEAALERVDLVLMPTSPSTAFLLGERLDDPLSMYLSDVFTVGVNLARLPAVSVPAGYSGQDLPVGIQLIGGAFADAELLRAAEFCESALGMSWRTPTAVRELTSR